MENHPLHTTSWLPKSVKTGWFDQLSRDLVLILSLARVDPLHKCHSPTVLSSLDIVSHFPIGFHKGNVFSVGESDNRVIEIYHE